MPTFAYKARNQSGAEVTGTLVADSAGAAARILDDRSLLPVEVEELKARERSLLTGQSRRISMSKIGVVYEQLADLLRAGVPLLRALKVLSEQASNPALSRVLREIGEEVASGDSLADAMEKHPNAFRPLHVTMIAAGEKGGFLEDVLTRLSQFVARQDALRNKFIGAMIYPMVLLTVGLTAVTLLMSFVVPQIREILEAQTLPTPTIIVFGISDLINRHGLELFGALLVVVIGVVAFIKSEIGARFWAHAQLKTPGFGKIFTMISLCRFCRIFGTLLNNGIPVLQALRISQGSTGNAILGEMIAEAADSVSGGEALSEPLARRKLFPPAMIDMIAVAEESNTLEKVLIEIADTQEERTGRQIDLFVKLLEPALLLIMGVLVLFIAVALLLPILQMATSGLK
ncbi:MAG: type II secretion system F family protein [Planctomycetota bacterium]|nr:MAG: type II secretion system F family protein [Planctomycetota bacterium]